MVAEEIVMRASATGTARYHARHAAAVSADHVRRLGDLSLSSVGLGSYLAPADDATDARYEAAVARSLALGANVVDAAIVYRNQRSERVLGRALRAAAAAGIARDEIVVASKAGFLGFDGDEPADVGAYFQRTIVDRGLAGWDEIAGGWHCLAPRYLAERLARSRENLGVATVDVYYLHNPETQLESVDRATFARRMRAAFEVLEGARADGAIARYGVATWFGLRVAPDARVHVDLMDLVAMAREVGGDRHGLEVVQLPLNQTLPEAAHVPTQRGRPVLEVARDLGLYVMTSASIMQGKLAHDSNAACAALEWTRTRPGVGTALVGTSRADHVESNARVFRRG
ncbi:MAG TPA: aldo/keto reductase [Kofleriaceae bacterium]|nr:aldo/keto reductase [Kofleriaceae bacterium]